MCRISTTIFHHKCTHTLLITTPSLNPACPIHIHQTTYLPRANCPKCKFWTSEFTDHEFEDRGGVGAACAGFAARETIRRVRIDRAQFGKVYGVAEKWERRRVFLEGMGSDGVSKEKRVFEGVRGREVEEGVGGLERSYFLDGGEVGRGEFFGLVEGEGGGGKDVKWCFCGREGEGKDGDREHLVSLPCGDIFHEKFVRRHFIASRSDTCPICLHVFNIFHPRPPYMPPNFNQEMREDLAVEKSWCGVWGKFGDLAMVVLVGILMMAFIYSRYRRSG